jgi:hypothetical protein
MRTKAAGLFGRGFTRAERWALLAVLSAGFVASCVVRPEELARLPELCPLHWAGLPCPGCGMSRAFCALSHGDWRGAVAYNALAPPAYLAAAALTLALGWNLLGPGLRRASRLLLGRLV